MKKLVLAVLATVLCLASAMAGEKKVMWEKPGMISNRSHRFSINKVVFTKEETVVHFHVRYAPHSWIRFAEATVLHDEAGKTYAIRSGKAVEEGETDLVPGAEFWMPESGEADIALHFEPMSLDTKRFDLIESYEDGDFKFWNICDNKKYKTALPDDWKHIKYAKNETLPDAKLEKGTARMRMKVLGYKPEMKLALMFLGQEIGNNLKVELAFPITDEGEMTAEIPLQYAQLAYVGIDGIWMAKMLLAPNETTECLMDLNMPEGKQIVAFKGYMARTNMDLFEHPSVVKYNGMEKDLYNDLSQCQTPEARVAYLDKQLETAKKKANALKVTDGAKALLRMQAEENYIDWRTDWDMKYTNLEMVMGIRKHTKGTDIRQWWEENSKMMPKWAIDEKTDYFELLGETYSPCYPKFWQILPSANDEGMIASLDRNGNPAKNNSDLRLTHWLIASEPDESTAMEATEYIGSEDCKAFVRDYYAKQRKKMEEAAADKRIHYQELDDVAPEAILDTILSRHPGRAVVIDMWATWCGPCRAGHKDMAPLKEELKQGNTPVVFVYLTNTTSPLNTWMSMTAEIPGEHYYLTQAQFNYIMDQYNSDGVPTYAIYGKDKQQRYLTVGYPGLQKMKEEIEKAL